MSHGPTSQSIIPLHPRLSSMVKCGDNITVRHTEHTEENI